MNRQQRSDERSRIRHKKIAAKLREHPELWETPVKNIQRWEQQMGKLSPALDEWRHILQTYSSNKILALLESDTEKAKRLRSSSPFTGILTESERQNIFQNFQEIA